MLKTIHYISLAYLVISLVLVMIRKYKNRLLAMLPPICQVASILLLDNLKFQLPFVAVLFLLNLAILIWVDMMEKKQMDLLPAEEETEKTDFTDFPDPAKTASSFVVDTDLLNPSFQGAQEADPLPLENASPELSDVPDMLLNMPEAENQPINVVEPVEQEIFSASRNEIEETIKQMMEAGETENAKRYLRMLAFFAKDESSRKMAEKKLAEINK